ncbi:uncharacterized protein LOC116341999 isoform X2 [Contarinia nasturtii]|uniref:uncharacterized protein LOC116341999 isoform X2 n=1 Tax=Contarinia nasturtii TaxID=265458 RepID=UPI0012D46694|nr:uncharacterized protein LOC116341999 isoform X2 [Contarinia nasturtii]
MFHQKLLPFFLVTFIIYEIFVMSVNGAVTKDEKGSSFKKPASFDPIKPRKKFGDISAEPSSFRKPVSFELRPKKTFGETLAEPSSFHKSSSFVPSKPIKTFGDILTETGDSFHRPSPTEDSQINDSFGWPLGLPSLSHIARSRSHHSLTQSELSDEFASARTHLSSLPRSGSETSFRTVPSDLSTPSFGSASTQSYFSAPECDCDDNNGHK